MQLAFNFYYSIKFVNFMAKYGCVQVNLVRFMLCCVCAHLQEVFSLCMNQGRLNLSKVEFSLSG